MPNHVKNRIRANGQDLTQFVSKTWNHSVFDFRLIIPQPEDVQSMGDEPFHVKVLAEVSLGFFDRSNLLDASEWADKLSQQDFDLFIAYLKNYRNTGAISNLDWQYKYWGTKWNSYGLKINAIDDIMFYTAWTPPHPVVEELAKRLDASTGILHEWADENTGKNVGRRFYHIMDGQLKHTEELLDYTEEGASLAKSIWQKAA